MSGGDSRRLTYNGNMGVDISHGELLVGETEVKSVAEEDRVLHEGYGRLYASNRTAMHQSVQTRMLTSESGA